MRANAGMSRTFECGVSFRKLFQFRRGFKPTMIFVSNPKLTMLVSVILILALLPQPILVVNGNTTYTRNLPSNTIYFDNFENGGNGTWLKFTFGSPTGNIVGVNKTRSFDGNASYGIYDPVINSQVEVQKTVATSATIIGIQAWTTFNYAMRSEERRVGKELRTKSR